MTLRNARIRPLLFLVPTILTLVVLGACAKKAPPSEPSSSSAGSQTGTGISPWTTEKPPTDLQVNSGADAYNRQGVLKRVHFETNRWEIVSEDRQILKGNAAWILAHSQFRVAVEGHCDERNTEAYNLALGERRANAAKEYLVGLGVPANKIQTVSYGKSRPSCTAHDEACWQQNRRDEFVLQDAK